MHKGRPFFFVRWCVIGLVASGCAIGAKSEVKQPIDRLNGENYQSDGPAATQINVPAPIIINKGYSRPTTVRGSVLLGEGPAATPARFAMIKVFSGDKMLTETTTDGDGKFTISAVIKNGHYVLKAIAGKRQRNLPIEISKYENDGVVILIP